MIWQLFYRYIFSARAGSIVKRIAKLTVFSLVFSISSLVIVLSVMTALNLSIRERLLSINPHVTIQVQGLSSPDMLEVHPIGTKLKMDKEIEVESFEQQDVIVRTLDGHFRGAVAKGISAESLVQISKRIQKLQAKSDGIMDFPDQLSAGEVIMGSDLAIAMGVFEGDTVMLLSPESLVLPAGQVPPLDKVVVKRIVTTTVADIDAHMLYYLKGKSLTNISSGPSKVLGYEVWLKASQGEQEFKKQYSLFEEAKISTWAEQNSGMLLALRLEKIMISLFLSCAALIAGFSMISVIVLLISQKKKEIAMLQVLGLSQKRTERMFQQMGVILASIGLFGGLLIGSGVAIYMENYPLRILPGIYVDSQIPSVWSFDLVLWIGILGFLFSITCSWVASRALRQFSVPEVLKGA